MKYTLTSLISSLLLASAWEAAAQIKVSPWQIHEGTDGLIEFETPTDKEKQEALEKAILPGKDDAGWTVAPAKDGIVDFDRPSNIPGGQGFKQLDFLYFQTVVTIPKGTAVKTFQVEFDSVDDGARVFIFNTKNPDGYFDPDHDIIKSSQKAKVDFSGHAAAGEENRIVVAQYDLCDPGNTIRGIRILVDGQEIPPPAAPLQPHAAPIPLTSNGDVHVRTPDGLAYDFQGTGEFLCAQSDDGNAVVQTRQESWDRKPSVSINTAAAILADGQKFEFYLKPKFRLFVNDAEQEASAASGTQSFPGGVNLETTLIGTGQSQYIVSWGDKSFAARVKVFHGSHMDVGIRRDSDAHKYTGMFGDLDKDPQNDMTLRDGGRVNPPANTKDLNTFTDSWRLKPEESLFGDVKRDNAQAAATKPHTEVQIDEAKRAAAEKAVRAAGITDPLTVRNATYDVVQTGSKVFIESAKAVEEAVKAQPAAAQKAVAGDAAAQAVLAGSKAPAGPSLKDQVVEQVAAGSDTWAGNWAWAADDNQPADHSKLIMKSETEFVYVYAGQTYNLKGKIGHSGGDPKAPLCVNLDLPNGDHLRFEWKTTEDVEAQFWKKGTKAGIERNNKPQTTAKMKRAAAK